MRFLTGLRYLPIGLGKTDVNIQFRDIAISDKYLEFRASGEKRHRYEIVSNFDNSYIITTASRSQCFLLHHNSVSYFHTLIAVGESLSLNDVKLEKGDCVYPIKTHNDVLIMVSRKIPFDPCIVNGVPSVSIKTEDYLELMLSA